MEIKIVKIENPNQLNLILGQSHFIKTVEDMHEAMVSTVPGAKFGLAFCEASDVCLVRHSGTDPELVELAKKNAFALAAGHSFIVFMRDMFPINVLNTVKNLPEVCRIFCATASCSRTKPFFKKANFFKNIFLSTLINADQDYNVIDLSPYFFSYFIIYVLEHHTCT